MNLPENPKIAIAGAVNSSLETLCKLIEHQCNICAVLALDPEKSARVSGYKDLKSTAENYKLPSKYFRNINDNDVFDYLDEKKPDLLFVVGLSQLVKKRLLNLPAYGSIGYHPTKLPKGRGRGAIAWIILGKAPGAATFFMMDEGMDSGPIVCQEPYQVTQNDYAQDVIDKVVQSIGKALDKLLPEINNGKLLPVQQNEQEATYLGRRKPQDGLIDWTKSANEIHRLIRATSSPLPGAYTFYENEKVKINKASIEPIEYIGIPGRILKIEKESILVATGMGALWLTEYDLNKKIIFKNERDFEHQQF